MTDTTAATVEFIDTTPYRPAVGDYATIREEYRDPRKATDAKVWRVAKLPTGRGVNVSFDDPEGGRGLKGPAYLFRKATDEEAAKAAAVTPTERAYVGAVVRITGPGWRQPEDAAYVVLGDSTKGGYKVAVLGGDKGRHWPHVPRAFVTILDAASVIVP